MGNTALYFPFFLEIFFKNKRNVSPQFSASIKPIHQNQVIEV